MVYMVADTYTVLCMDYVFGRVSSYAKEYDDTYFPAKTGRGERGNPSTFAWDIIYHTLLSPVLQGVQARHGGNIVLRAAISGRPTRLFLTTDLDGTRGQIPGTAHLYEDNLCGMICLWPWSERGLIRPPTVFGGYPPRSRAMGWVGSLLNFIQDADAGRTIPTSRVYSVKAV